MATPEIMLISFPLLVVLALLHKARRRSLVIHGRVASKRMRDQVNPLLPSFGWQNLGGPSFGSHVLEFQTLEGPSFGFHVFVEFQTLEGPSFGFHVLVEFQTLEGPSFGHNVLVECCTH